MIEMMFNATVGVEVYAGEGRNGPTFNPKITLTVFVEEVNRLIATGMSEERTAGRQSSLQFSTTVLFASIDDLASFPVGSRVTLPSGAIGRVQQCNTFVGPGGLIGADHLEIHVI